MWLHLYEVQEGRMNPRHSSQKGGKLRREGADEHGALGNFLTCGNVLSLHLIYTCKESSFVHVRPVQLTLQYFYLNKIEKA